MQYFDKGRSGRTITIYLSPGDDVLGSINTIIKETGITDGYVVCGIGSLTSCCLHMVMTTSYPPVNHFERWHDKPLELAALSGVIANGEPHLHAVVSTENKAVAGHLEPGCEILYLGEVVIQETVGQKLKRVKNKQDIDELIQN